MILIDGKKFKEKFAEIWLAERRFSHESLGISLDDLCKAIDQPEFQVPIKSPEEVERVIKYFQQDEDFDIHQIERWSDIVALIRYLHPELGQKQDTWKDKDFNET